LRIAFLTDIHGNKEALQAVLRAVRADGFDKLVFLGDLVGYGPDPADIVETVGGLVDQGALCIKGNHDEAAIIGGGGMSENAKIAIEWTQKQLRQPHLDFLKNLPMQVEEEDRLYIHASADRPEKWNYVRSADMADRSLAATNARLTFAGHTHIPAVFHALPGKPSVAFVPARDVPMPLSGLRRAVTIVGAVGQPRDGISAACYGMFDARQRTITMKRVAYDYSETAEKIRRAGLPFWLGDRLALGK
jgi:diadenosine tetraphosphatase ApaH/serine/threonine PP2A family protein phosphatase